MRRFSLFLLLLPSLAHAAGLWLVWEYPRTGVQPDAFLIAYASTDGGDTLQQMTTPPSSVAACAAVSGDNPDVYCTQWPGCPAPGVYAFFLQAQFGQELSEKTNLAACQIEAAHPCVCVALETDPEAPPATTPAPVGHDPGVPPLPPWTMPPVSASA
jgi:hypothetical protein